jgi:hypothetical protein
VHFCCFKADILAFHRSGALAGAGRFPPIAVPAQFRRGRGNIGNSPPDSASFCPGAPVQGIYSVRLRSCSPEPNIVALGFSARRKDACVSHGCHKRPCVGMQGPLGYVMPLAPLLDQQKKQKPSPMGQWLGCHWGGLRFANPFLKLCFVKASGAACYQ